MVCAMTFGDWQTWVFLGSLGFLGYDHFQLRREVSAAKVDLANLRTHVAENYVRSPEVIRLSDELTSLRHTVEEAVKLLHEIKGAQQPTRG
jgi:hypothetical protein